MNVAQWQPTPHRQTVTPLPWCVLLFPYLAAIPPEIKMAIQILPLSLGCDRSLSTIFDTHCSVTDISQFSFSRMKTRRVAIELGHVREHMRGEEIDTRECPALTPLFLLCWLFSAKIGKTCYTQECTPTHSHTHRCTHISRSMRENFVPIKCLSMPFPDSPVPSTAWGSLWISEWMALALRLLFNRTASHVAITAEAEAQVLRKHIHLRIKDTRENFSEAII